MSDWVVVPCLLVLRDEFNRAGPNRDKGADGTIGDSAHTSSSDHTPDEDSDVLRDHDADSKNEVHALDIDSSGPWPESGWFNRTILALVAREKADYESPTVIGRLQYVIHNRRIASRSWGWTWRDYDGSDPHTNHAHFSARYLTAAESSTRPWGVYEEDDVTPAEIAAIAKAVWEYDLTNPYSNVVQDAGTILRYAPSRSPHDTTWQKLDALAAAVAGIDVVDDADRSAIVAGVLAGLSPAAIAAAIPGNLAEQVADELAARLAA